MIKLILKLFCISLFTTSLFACAAKSTPNDWKSDCVGNMQLSFPSEVDLATSPESRFKYELVNNDYYTAEYTFQDNENAGFSLFDGLLISKPLDETMKNRIEKYFENNSLDNLSGYEKLTDSEKKLHSVEQLNLGVDNVKAYRGDDDIRILMTVNNRIILTGVPSRSGLEEIEPAAMAKLIAENIKKAKLISSAYKSRDLYEIPKEEGLCLPYIFQKTLIDDSHIIAMTYRLKSHPDITFWLKHSSAAPYAENGKSLNKYAEPEEIINSFWANYGRQPNKKMGIYTIWEEPRYYHSVKLAGQKGLATFMQIERYERVKKPYHRPNEEVTDYNAYYQQKAKEEYAEKHPKKHIDYGYFATARGNPKDNTPDLSFYVIQESSHAIAKGIKPLTKDEVLELAETIAASVKQRPVQ